MKKYRLLLILFITCLFFSIASVSAAIKELDMGVGESKILHAEGITRVSTSNPNVIEVVVTGTQEILLNAKGPGVSMINIWARRGILTYRIKVNDNYGNLEKEISRLIDNPNVKVIVNQKYVILNGTVETTLEADRAVEYAKMYRDNVLNNLNVKVKYQVLLTILVTEMRKESQNKYGFRWGSWVQTKDGIVFYDWQWAMKDTGGSIAKFPGNWSIGTMVEAMQKNGDAKILAAPSILTISGKEASFLAGGELPIPRSDGDKVIVEWKEYGVKLKVTATIVKDDEVLLTVAPEVSSLDWANAVMVEGYKMPAIATRKASTNLLFKEGSTLVIGGLLKREDSTTVFKLPIIGDLPIVGSLFRSKEFQKGDTELLFFVTPKIIKEGNEIGSDNITKDLDQGPFFQSDATDK